jgi:hypothetical protein
LDGNHDAVDGSANEVLPTTTHRKAGLGQEEGRHSPREVEWTYLVGEGTIWGTQKKQVGRLFFCIDNIELTQV